MNENYLAIGSFVSRYSQIINPKLNMNAIRNFELAK